MTLSTDFLTFFFLFYCVLYNLFLCLYFLFTQFLLPRRANKELAKDLPIITVMIPSLNEEKVIEKTVLRLIALPYPGKLEVLIIDDNSDDGTLRIAEKLRAAYSNVHLLCRDFRRSQQGKGDCLNHGFSFLRTRFADRDLERWVIGVFDADGRAVEDDLLIEVGKAFSDSSVAAAQCGVRIRNGDNLLAALQDVEFATFSFITQTVRNRTSGAVALGGNGQFIRANVLDQLGQRGNCWDNLALTEDLDIGTRIHLSGGRIKFINRWVKQEGVESFKVLLRQRHRWAWGTLRVFLKYVLSGRIMSSKMPLAKKLDLQYYLSFWIVPFVVLLSFFLSVLNLMGVLKIINSFGLSFLLANSFSFVPMMVLGLAWAKVPVYKIVYLVPLAVVYAYHWVLVLILGWVSILTHQKPRWVKTERYAMEEVTK
jgi:cellulose synthase/poly-beta-1,6-N-acetylglucosamine synthase-like glycosyltransferase